MSDDRIVISSEPGVTPDDVARRSFPVVFRGFDQDQVRRYLKKVSDELVAAREREQELRQALEQTRSTLAHPELDEATLTSFAGLDVTVRAGVTVIVGQFDQAALHGMLEMIRLLGLDLEEARRVAGSGPRGRSR